MVQYPYKPRPAGRTFETKNTEQQEIKNMYPNESVKPQRASRRGSYTNTNVAEDT